jgi:hypothetical protein
MATTQITTEAAINIKSGLSVDLPDFPMTPYIFSRILARAAESAFRGETAVCYGKYVTISRAVRVYVRDRARGVRGFFFVTDRG